MAIHYDVNEYLVNNGTPPVTDSPLTLSCLVYPWQVNLWRPLVIVGSSAGAVSIYSVVITGGTVSTYVRSGPSTGIATAGGVVGTNTWHHAAMINYSDTSRAAFHDGGNKGTNNSNVNPDPGLFDQTVIGRWPQLGSNIDGDVAEVGIWDTDLEDEEIAILGQYVSPLLVRPESLVFYLPSIRDIPGRDLVGGLSMVAGNTPYATPHPRVHYPKRNTRSIQQIGFAAPSDLTCSVVSSVQIHLEWVDNSDDELGFKIERARDLAGPWDQIAIVGANVTTYDDIGLDPNTEYCYRVRAYK